MYKNFAVIILLCTMLLALVSVHPGAESAQTTPPITLNLALEFDDYFTLDPTETYDANSDLAVSNILLGLVDLDPVTSEIVPKLAQSWEISPDGLTFTFVLRDDVWWVYQNPETDTIEKWKLVTATDVVASVRRACQPNPDTGGNKNPYGEFMGEVIRGCADLYALRQEQAEVAPLDTVKVTATDEHTVVFELRQPTGYFLSLFVMPFMRITPADTSELSFRIIPTDGAFAVGTINSEERTFIRNPYLPDDLQYDGNIEVVHFQNDEGGSEHIYDLYLSYEVDQTTIPATHLDIVGQPQYAAELVPIRDATVYYYAFFSDRSPFNNVHVRRAFSAIIDRTALLEQIRQGRGIPLKGILPETIPLAVPIDENGVGFDPDYAREEMELAGYPNCRAFPPIDVAVWEGGPEWGDFLAHAAEEYLGCPSSLIYVTEWDPSTLSEISGPDISADRPNIRIAGWAPYYPDPATFTVDLLGCEPAERFEIYYGRECNEIDDRMIEAARTVDQDKRAQQYIEIEEMFFGPEGEFPIIPLFQWASYWLVQDWYTGPFYTEGTLDIRHWDAYSIDMEAKLAAQN